MLIRDIIYRGVNLSDSLARSNHIVIQEVIKTANLRTTVFDRDSYHGSITSNTLASGRLWTFRGQIFGFTDSERWIGQNLLNNIIKPEGMPSDANRGFYDLSWYDESGRQYKTKAKVHKMPEYNRELRSPIMDFTFELYSEDPTYKSYADLNATGSLGYVGGMALSCSLPRAMSAPHKVIAIVNSGNHIAPCRISTSGSVQNPMIRNLTTGRYYGLSGVTTSSFVLDNRTRDIVVTDAGLNVAGYRTSGSKLLLLDPGANSILITGDNFSIDNSVTVSVEWNDSFIHS